MPMAEPDFYPSQDKFTASYARGEGQTLHTQIISDLETPVSAYLKLTGAQKNSFLLESVEGGETLGRYSIIGCDPDLVWEVRGGQAARLDPQTNSWIAEDQKPLDSFNALIAESALPHNDALPPMAAGVFGMFGYDMVREIEDLPNRPPNDLDLASARLIRPRLIAVFDNIKHTLTLVTPVYPVAGLAAEEAYRAACYRLRTAVASLSGPIPSLARSAGMAIEPVSNTPKADYLSMVERAKDYIRAGDIFQVVLSQRFETPFAAPPFSLYRSLRRENPSPFLFHFDFGDFSVVGSSPEILVRVQDGEITIRPIAGTRKRGATREEDMALSQALLADPKERAEHLMLLDLGRNDVGRAAETGSVAVTDSFAIERYSHVMHMVSNVTGRLRADLSPLDAVMAGFPAGTVSGAPKVRAMEIIDEMERAGRGAYAGALGYFSATGNVDTAITLRTGIIKEGTLYVQAGAGIVADSDPESEHAECLNKARAIFSAAEKIA